MVIDNNTINQNILFDMQILFCLNGRGLAGFHVFSFKNIFFNSIFFNQDIHH